MEDSENSGNNKFFDGKDKSMGIIACGIAYNYLMENFREEEIPYPVLKIGQYPLSKKQIRDFYHLVDSVLVMEEGYPIIEELLRGYLDEGKPVKGRMDGTLPRVGELNPNLAGKALGVEEIAAEPADIGQAPQGDGEPDAPTMVEAHGFEVRIDPDHRPAHETLDGGRISARSGEGSGPSPSGKISLIRWS